MTPWCRDQIPIEGNFGQLFDQLDVSFSRLSKEFRAELVLQVRAKNANTVQKNIRSRLVHCDHNFYQLVSSSCNTSDQSQCHLLKCHSKIFNMAESFNWF